MLLKDYESHRLNITVGVSQLICVLDILFLAYAILFLISISYETSVIQIFRTS